MKSKRALPASCLDSMAIGQQNIIFHERGTKGETVGDKLDAISLSVQVAINTDDGNSEILDGVLLGHVVLTAGGST